MLLIQIIPRRQFVSTLSSNDTINVVTEETFSSLSSDDFIANYDNSW